MPGAFVYDVLAARRGEILIATTGGVCRIESWVSPRCEVIRPADPAATVTVLFEDRGGVIWAGTVHGLYQLRGARLEPVEAGMPHPAPSVSCLAEDRRGSLWISTDGAGLYRRLPGGRTERYGEKQGLPVERVSCFSEDSSGRLWVGTTNGLCLLAANPSPERAAVERVYGLKDGLPSALITGLVNTRDGKLWVAASDALAEMEGTRFVPRLTKGRLATLFEDREGNLWFGSTGAGVGRISRRGFTTFTEADGIRGQVLEAILESRSGELCVVSRIDSAGRVRKALGYLQGDRFAAVYPAFPKQIRYYGDGWSQVGFQSRDGEWWHATGEGLARFPAVARIEDLARTPPKALYGVGNGLPLNHIYRLFEDSRGDVWIGTGNATRWERRTGLFHNFPAPAGVANPTPSAFGEDGQGGVWIGYYMGGVARCREGRMRAFLERDGMPQGFVHQILTDHKGRLWIAMARSGVVRVEDPAAEHPRFARITPAQGLASASAYCLAEDRWGRIYIGTGRGIDRLDPDTGRIRRYTMADGLVQGELRGALRARDGALWFLTTHGISRLSPEPDQPRTPPAALITAVRVRGVAQRLESGRSLNLQPDQNQVQIDFVSPSFGEPLRYQYRLEGADAGWSAPGETRTVNYASLAPGGYRFLARPVTSEGLTAPEPASVRFTIAPPVWRRAWFLGLAMLAAGGAVYAAHRYRLRQVLAIAQVRTRIATDLHDDIGASLSQIAILNEVARSRLDGAEPRIAGPLAEAAAISRELVDSMSDIVWAINPKHDHLSNLTHRVRRFASEILGARDIELEFRAPVGAQDLPLSPEVRRQIFLIAKEAVHNIARHSGASQAVVAFERRDGRLVVRVSDNGRGFDAAASTDGNGLANMRRRAASVGGVVDFDSGAGTGTAITVSVPLGRPASYPPK
ncbi:MAG: hypothetical protein HYR60_33795 [Acidobacteria bacterium]|nr:hypothetical protein [Acidobacteriota bacterium]